MSVTWSPYQTTISNITNSNPGVVTTSFPHDYLTGLYIRIFMPANFGMTQVNGNIYLISVIDGTTFSIDQDTSNFDVFTNSNTSQQPQATPIGEISAFLLMAVRNTLIPIGGPGPP